MTSIKRKWARKIFGSLGINRSLVLHAQHANAFKAKKQLTTNPRPVIFDIGAYDGRSAREYIKHFPGAEIHSFEPFPASFQKLAASKLGRHHILQQSAVADIAGDTTLQVNALSVTNSLLSSNETGKQVIPGMQTKETIIVPVTTIDQYCTKNNINEIGILKIDVQGAEMKVLKGAENMLNKKSIKLIYFEVGFLHFYNDQPLFEDLSLYLRSKAYTFHSLYNFSWTRSGELIYADALFKSL